VPLSLKLCIVGVEEISWAMSRIFAIPHENAVYKEIVGLNRVQGYVNVLGELTDPALFNNGSLAGAPRRCGALRLLMSCSFVLCRHGGVVVIGHGSNMFHRGINQIVG
jgi:hypothetical protein